VERTEPEVTGARALQLHVLANDLYDVGALRISAMTCSGSGTTFSNVLDPRAAGGLAENDLSFGIFTCGDGSRVSSLSALGQRRPATDRTSAATGAH